MESARRLFQQAGLVVCDQLGNVARVARVDLGRGWGPEAPVRVPRARALGRAPDHRPTGIEELHRRVAFSVQLQEHAVLAFLVPEAELHDPGAIHAQPRQGAGSNIAAGPVDIDTGVQPLAGRAARGAGLDADSRVAFYRVD